MFLPIVLASVFVSLSSQASDSQSCIHAKKVYSHGSSVQMDEPCLSCSCARGQLVCHLRMCPTLPEIPAKNCKIYKPVDKCCPQIVCDNISSHNSTGFGKFVRTNQVGRNDDDSFYYYRSQLRRPTSSPVEPNVQKNSGCKLEDSYFADGSALPSNSTCRHCYCLKGTIRCIKPKCHLNIVGCDAKYSHAHSCCPTHYDCSALAAMSMNNDETTTSEPVKKVCLWHGRRYNDGSRIATDDICRSCFCVRGRVKCTTQVCTPSAPGCKPVVHPGHCCPVSFTCDSVDEDPFEDDYLLENEDDLSTESSNVSHKIRENDRVIDFPIDELKVGHYQLVKRTSATPASQRRSDRVNGLKGLRPTAKLPSYFRVDSENDEVVEETESKKSARSAASMLYFPARVNNRRNLFPKRTTSTTTTVTTVEDDSSTTLLPFPSIPLEFLRKVKESSGETEDDDEVEVSSTTPDLPTTSEQTTTERIDTTTTTRKLTTSEPKVTRKITTPTSTTSTTKRTTPKTTSTKRFTRQSSTQTMTPTTTTTTTTPTTTKTTTTTEKPTPKLTTPFVILRSTFTSTEASTTTTDEPLVDSFEEIGGHHTVDVEESNEFDGLHGEPAAIDWPSPLDGDVYDYFREFNHMNGESGETTSTEEELTSSTTSTTTKPTTTSTKPSTTNYPSTTTTSTPLPTTTETKTTPSISTTEVPTTTTPVTSTTVLSTSIATTPSTIFLHRVGLNFQVSNQKPSTNSGTNWTSRLIPDGHPAADASARVSKIGTATIQRLPHYEGRGSTRLLVADDEIIAPKVEADRSRPNIDKTTDVESKSEDSNGFQVIPFLPEDAIVGESKSNVTVGHSLTETMPNLSTSRDAVTNGDLSSTTTSGDNVGSVGNFFMDLLGAMKQTMNDNDDKILTPSSIPNVELSTTTTIDDSKWIPIRGEPETETQNNSTDVSTWSLANKDDSVDKNDEDEVENDSSPSLLGLLSLFGFSGLGGASRRNQTQPMPIQPPPHQLLESTKSNDWQPIKNDGSRTTINDSGTSDRIFDQPISTAALSGMRMPNATGNMFLIGQPKEETLPIVVDQVPSSTTTTIEPILDLILSHIQKSSSNNSVDVTNNENVSSTLSPNSSTVSTTVVTLPTSENRLTATQIVSIDHKIENHSILSHVDTSTLTSTSTKIDDVATTTENDHSRGWELYDLLTSSKQTTNEENLVSASRQETTQANFVDVNRPNFPFLPSTDYQPIPFIGGSNSFKDNFQNGETENQNGDEDKMIINETENEAGSFNPFLLQVKGCDIYGEYYNMGDVITELSSVCEECVCSGLGVDCHRKC